MDSQSRLVIEITLSCLKGKLVEYLLGMRNEIVSYDELKKCKDVATILGNAFPKTTDALGIDIRRIAHAVYRYTDQKGIRQTMPRATLRSSSGIYLDIAISKARKAGSQACDCSNIDCPDHPITLHVCLVPSDLKAICDKGNRLLRAGPDGTFSIRCLDAESGFKAKSVLASSETSSQLTGGTTRDHDSKSTVSKASVNAATVKNTVASRSSFASHRKPANNRQALESTTTKHQKQISSPVGAAKSRPRAENTVSTAQKLQATTTRITGSKTGATRVSEAVSNSTRGHKPVSTEIDNTTEQNCQAERSKYEKEAAAIREATDYKQELSFERDGIDEVMEAKIISSFYAKIGQHSVVLPPMKANSAEHQVIPNKRQRDSTPHDPASLNTLSSATTKHNNDTSHIITLKLPHLANATQSQTATAAFPSTSTPWIEPPLAPDHLLRRPLPTATGWRYDPKPVSDSEWMNPVVIPKNEREEIQKRERDERADRRLRDKFVFGG
ncbi:hypothetical protein PMZ80_009227 [Knufia obscura]|uniref:Uncharacterized protein n=1 Tax=Knufia obscura TaxID=1635080 RepID=A0ABR0RDE7_9EURO|nr:hypothetical protein PMZ80_009227 [Knufia obscura]